MVGLALHNCIVSLFSGPFCFSCVFWRFPNGFPILWFSIGNALVCILFNNCSSFSIILRDFHMFPYIILVLFGFLMIVTFPLVFLNFTCFPLFPMIFHDFHDFLIFSMILREFCVFSTFSNIANKYKSGARFSWPHFGPLSMAALRKAFSCRTCV